MGNTCVSGSCAPCNGCIDISTGQCLVGTSNTQCGRNGTFCQACDQMSGQTCQAGICSGGTSCNAATCTGCCDGNTCRPIAQQTNAQCGQGVAGAACTTCLNGTMCSAGQCVMGGTDGGPTFDGGFDICALNGDPCPANKCCEPLLTVQLGVSSCVDPGVDCDFGFSGQCNAQTLTCQ